MQRMKERIVHAFSLRVNLDCATRKHAFGDSFAGLAGALVRVGEDGDASSVVAAIGGEQPVSGKPGAIVSAEELHELIAVRSQIARLHAPLRPRRGGVLVVL